MFLPLNPALTNAAAGPPPDGEGPALLAAAHGGDPEAALPGPPGARLAQARWGRARGKTSTEVDPACFWPFDASWSRALVAIVIQDALGVYTIRKVLRNHFLTLQNNRSNLVQGQNPCANATR